MSATLSGIALLLVEDDENLAASLREYLEAEGYTVTRAATVAEGARALEPAHRLVILDWMLPDGAGIDLLSRWRRAGDGRPVILLTARGELVDRVLGLELGADDYVVKPFEPRELLARIRARLRTADAAPEQPADAGLLCHGSLALDPRQHRVTLDDEVVELSPQEHALLKVFLAAPGRVFSREELLNEAWGYEHYPTTRTVDTHVLQLRQKLGAWRIETVRGIGYRLGPETEG